MRSDFSLNNRHEKLGYNSVCYIGSRIRGCRWMMDDEAEDKIPTIIHL